MKKIILFVILILLISLVTALKDFDKDGMPDSWEKKYGLKYDVNDANLDPDNDGLTNLQEYQKGTNPLESDIKTGFFASVFGFLGKNIVKILLGIAALIIIYFVFKIMNEFFKLRKKKKERKKPEKEKVVKPIVGEKKKKYIQHIHIFLYIRKEYQKRKRLEKLFQIEK